MGALVFYMVLRKPPSRVADGPRIFSRNGIFTFAGCDLKTKPEK
jgi:hypothetical protein